jgi:citrate lyase beta subunit
VKSIGMKGKYLIHPARSTNRIFRPTDDEVERAKVVAAFDGRSSAATLRCRWTGAW